LRDEEAIKVVHRRGVWAKTRTRGGGATVAGVFFFSKGLPGSALVLLVKSGVFTCTLKCLAFY
jgi:hypothetical protein